MITLRCYNNNSLVFEMSKAVTKISDELEPDQVKEIALLLNDLNNTYEVIEDIIIGD